MKKHASAVRWLLIPLLERISCCCHFDACTCPACSCLNANTALFCKFQPSWHKLACYKHGPVPPAARAKIILLTDNFSLQKICDLTCYWLQARSWVPKHSLPSCLRLREHLGVVSSIVTHWILTTGAPWSLEGVMCHSVHNDLTRILARVVITSPACHKFKCIGD